MADRRKDKTHQLAKRIPGFRGYRAVHALETDWLLRRFLAGEVEKVRDRLAALLAAGVEEADLRDRLATCLRTVARVKEEMEPGKDEKRRWEPTAEAEEGLLDLDLALDDRVAALHAPVANLETDNQSAGDALPLFEEGLKEVKGLLRRRREILDGAKRSG